MAYNTKLGKPDAKGNFKRDLGKKPTGQPIRFYLGRDATVAQARMDRLEGLWAKVETTSEHPMWDWGSMAVARQIAKGGSTLKIAAPENLTTPEDFRAYVKAVDDLVIRFGHLISILPADMESYRAGQLANIDRQKEVIQIAKEVWPDVPNILESDSASLHESLDAYAKAMAAEHVDPETKQRTAYCNVALKQIQMLKDRHENLPLNHLVIGVIKQAFQYWSSRPLVKGKNRPISVRSAENYIKRLKHFLWWLHDCEDFRWKAPAELARIKCKIRQTEKEKQASISPLQVKAFTEEQIGILYRYATPIERVYLMLGLNCGFAVSEFGTLRLNQIFLRQLHGHDKAIGYASYAGQSWIKRVRLKSKVYSEWILWDETVAAIEWAIERRRKQIDFNADALLVLTDRNLPYSGQTEGGNNSSRIGKLWYRGLLKRIRKDYSDFPQLSPKSLRKTAGNLIRSIAGGEVMGIFLAHGQPVQSDDLAEQYSNKPFGKVFEALELLRQRLMPCFQAVSDPFPMDRTQSRSGGASISLKTLDRIKAMRAEGKKHKEIAAALGVSLATVYRKLGPVV